MSDMTKKEAIKYYRKRWTKALEREESLQVRLDAAHEDYQIQVDAIVAMQDRLDAVKPYLRHKNSCYGGVKKYYEVPINCDCGLTAALKQETGQ